MCTNVLWKFYIGGVFIEPITIIFGCAGVILGVIFGVNYRKRISEAKIGTAEERAVKIVEEAKRDAEAKSKEILLEAKEESIKTKNELEKEVRELKEYIEDVFTDQNDINEDTRMQLDLINQALAELQVKNKVSNRPKKIGFQLPEE